MCVGICLSWKFKVFKIGTLNFELIENENVTQSLVDQTFNLKGGNKIKVTYHTILC